MSAVEDGVIDSREKQKLWGLFNKKMRHQFHGMLGFLAMYGVSDGAVDLFITSNRKVTPQVCSLRRRLRVHLCVEK